MCGWCGCGGGCVGVVVMDLVEVGGIVWWWCSEWRCSEIECGGGVEWVLDRVLRATRSGGGVIW